MNAKVSKIKLKCETCGKFIERYPSEVYSASHYYCSPACRAKGRTLLKEEKYTLKCDFCGKEYTTTKTSFNSFIYHFCCAQCRQQGLRRENRKIIDERKRNETRTGQRFNNKGTNIFN